jgi:hypothetical protein
MEGEVRLLVPNGTGTEARNSKPDRQEDKIPLETLEEEAASLLQPPTLPQSSLPPDPSSPSLDPESGARQGPDDQLRLPDYLTINPNALYSGIFFWVINTVR